MSRFEHVHLASVPQDMDDSLGCCPRRIKTYQRYTVTQFAFSVNSKINSISKDTLDIFKIVYIANNHNRLVVTSYGSSDQMKQEALNFIEWTVATVHTSNRQPSLFRSSSRSTYLLPLCYGIQYIHYFCLLREVQLLSKKH